MRRIVLFQVGDVHYPDHGSQDADVKDKAFPESLITAATSSRLQAATKELLGCLARESEPLLVFSGDLTSRGDSNGYSDCVGYLVKAFLLDQPSTWPADRIHVVPGNHDVNRSYAAAQPPKDLLTKFTPLRDAWQAHGLDVIATDNVRTTTHDDAAARLTFFDLNSCVGCGEKRDVAPAVITSVSKAMAAEGLGDRAIANVIAGVKDGAETMDAPAFLESHIAEVYHAIRQNEVGLPVITAHHNILQQALPRFDLYTDLINAGMFRSRLASLGGTVLYLHGHIHSDAIEIIQQATPDRGQIVCVSCPEFVDGFNQIEVWFTETGIALGCVVTKYRTRLHGGISEELPPVRISFLRNEASLSSLARDVAGLLLTNPGIGLVSEVHKHLDDHTLEQVAEAVREVEWLGLVEILSPERQPKHWRLRVVNIDD